MVILRDANVFKHQQKTSQRFNMRNHAVSLTRIYNFVGATCSASLWVPK